ncbi:unnamed protein product [Rhizoctonia solani]|uniref:Uncharacterized protein n=1 Tax=Rhizoctonia solani TaxID=456999 RepID=A0A8H3HAR5_9AGAM|nr:unnamed protein product [Rhizoctonia solani]
MYPFRALYPIAVVVVLLLSKLNASVNPRVDHKGRSVCVCYARSLALSRSWSAWRTGCVMNDNDVALAEFYFYTLGDKTVYNQQLNDLFVCYTLSRGLRYECDHPRRPALPLELILRITRYAGFIDSKPDLNLTADANILAKSLTQGLSSDLYMTDKLTRAQLASMARLQFIELLWDDSEPPYGSQDTSPYTWAFIPLGTQEERLGFMGSPKGIVAALFPCRNETEASAVRTLSEDVILGDTFPPDHVISQQLEDGEVPCVVVISRVRARLLVWRWWEPKF